MVCMGLFFFMVMPMLKPTACSGRPPDEVACTCSHMTRRAPEWGAQTKNPAVDLPIGIVGSLLACSALYAGLALTLCLMARAPCCAARR